MTRAVVFLKLFFDYKDTVSSCIDVHRYNSKLMAFKVEPVFKLVLMPNWIIFDIYIL